MSVNSSCRFLPAVKLATMGSALVHKLARGLPPWAPLKGHSIKSYKQIQSEAIEKREREKAVLRENDGIWPGESTPTHAMFLWAGGAELTDLLEQGTKQNMPHKFISYEARYFPLPFASSCLGTLLSILRGVSWFQKTCSQLH